MHQPVGVLVAFGYLFPWIDIAVALNNSHKNHTHNQIIVSITTDRRGMSLSLTYIHPFIPGTALSHWYWTSIVTTNAPTGQYEWRLSLPDPLVCMARALRNTTTRSQTWQLYHTNLSPLIVARMVAPISGQPMSTHNHSLRWSLCGAWW